MLNNTKKQLTTSYSFPLGLPRSIPGGVSHRPSKSEPRWLGFGWGVDPPPHARSTRRGPLLPSTAPFPLTDNTLNPLPSPIATLNEKPSPGGSVLIEGADPPPYVKHPHPLISPPREMRRRVNRRARCFRKVADREEEYERGGTRTHTGYGVYPYPL